jgi:hypothetical protein
VHPIVGRSPVLHERAGSGCGKTHIADEADAERDEEQVKAILPPLLRIAEHLQARMASSSRPTVFTKNPRAQK